MLSLRRGSSVESGASDAWSATLLPLTQAKPSKHATGHLRKNTTEVEAEGSVLSRSSCLDPLPAAARLRRAQMQLYPQGAARGV